MFGRPKSLRDAPQEPSPKGRPQSLAPQEPFAKRRQVVTPKGQRMQLPEPECLYESMDKSISKIEKECRQALEALQEGRGERPSWIPQVSSRQLTQEDERFMMWLKQESDNPQELAQHQEAIGVVKLPQDRKKLYDWLKFYHSYVVLHKEQQSESASGSSSSASHNARQT